ncbi:DUF7827 domain-containing protein [Halogeometricum limi]|uniref:PGF-CTERM protein/surface glycoprotein n=1 Tax=Halogeometricum limi TaxID=555875 RepID=A0A1I6ICQ0_9EURY|nr:BGTF surface domain-containing protein [Halogeometricum limi]SFR64481.1 PGF-CTERM protein/surface glycoprotein [Halogeometricum limi]
MTQTSQFRAVFLAALMVLSVFAGSVAFTGSAAADDHTFMYEGGAVHYVDTSGNSVIEVPFNTEVNSSSQTVANFTLMDDGENVSDEITGFSTTDGTLVIQTTDVIKSNDLTLDISSDVQNSTGANISNAGEKSVAFAPVTVEAGDDLDAYQGSKVAIVTENTSTDVEIEGDADDNSFFRSGSTGANSTVYVFDTASRDLGQYNVVLDNNQSRNASITVRDLGLSVDVDDTTIDTDSDVEGTVTANAGDRTVNVKLLDSDGDEVENETVELSGQAEADFSFSVSDAGNYTVEATDLDSGVAAESSSVVVSKAGEGKASFPNDGKVISEQRGDIANITVNLENADEATLMIGSEDSGFVSNVTVEDGSGDGQVSVLFNTYAATGVSGNADSLYEVADDDDSVESSDVSEDVSTLLDAGEYDLEVRVASGDDTQDVGTLVLEERETTSLNSWTAADGSEIEDSDDVYAAINNSNITQDDEVAFGDLSVHQLEASGLAGALEATDDDTTAAFFALNGSAYSLTVEQTEAGANREPFMLALGEDNTTVIADAENDTYFIVFDTDEVNTSDRDLEAGDGLTANFTVAKDEGNLTDEEQSVENSFELVEAEHTLDDVTVAASSNQSIAGETTVAPGTEINLRVRSDGDTQPSFLKTATAYVTENGTYEAMFDFSEQSANDTFTVTVRGGVADSITADGTVSAADNDSETSTEVSETVTATEAPTDTEMATEEPTDTEMATEEPEETATATEAPAETETETSTPGFGAVVAVTALLAAALLAVRRD